MSLAQQERQALVATMAEVGPDAPTLCGEWTTRDLAAHLIVRERKPHTAPGLFLKPFAGYLASEQNKVARQPYADLLELIRTGPPWWSPFKPIDAVANLSEMFVHHEDVRRSQPQWQPRELSAADEATLWSVVKRMGRVAYRKSPVTVVLSTAEGERLTVRNVGGDAVVLTGKASELLLHAFGRNQVRIDAAGNVDDVAAVFASDRSV
ncbi:MAG: TIGR03085 family protein [Nocardia sp.]|nr:TIGR03085 family protein [Nocardia sp.]